MGCLGALSLCISSQVHAQAQAQAAYPNKPIRLVVGYAPGGSADIAAHPIADRLRLELGQLVISDNRPGAGGNIGTEAVARAAPDGNTILLAASGQIVINPSLNKKMLFDPTKDLVPITQRQNEHNLMVVNPAIPARTVGEFIAYAKSRPEGITYASPGVGSPAHLAGELMNQMAGLQMQHVPYKGSGPARNDLIAGHVTT